jgi:formylglycine-generating enzyme required for sulfatase activity
MSFRDMIQKFPTPAGMVPIPAGSFRMGSDAGHDDEKPVHEVTLTYSFWMGTTPVTQEQFQALMGVNPSRFEGAKLPVEQVSWRDARIYCERLTKQQSMTGSLPTGYEYRLPTEAEWEYACRAGTTTEYNTGDVLLPTQANLDDEDKGGDLGIVPVASYPANAWGLYDMHGNVWEWCLDSYAAYSAGAVKDPFVTGGPYRVIRGGGWVSDSNHCRSAYRFNRDPGYTGNSVGFRVVLAPVLVP